MNMETKMKNKDKILFTIMILWLMTGMISYNFDKIWGITITNIFWIFVLSILLLIKKYNTKFNNFLKK